MPQMQSEKRMEEQRLTWRGAGWIFVAAFLVAAPGSLQGEEIPFVRIKSPKEAPVIDGKIKGIYTNNATPLNFTFLNGAQGTQRAKTTAYLLADAKSLYVAIRCETANPDQLLCSKTKHDDEIWSDECVEMFIDPKNSRGKDYFHIVVNPAGVTQDSRAGDLSWNPAMEVRCGKEGGKAWVAEIRIPLEELGVKAGNGCAWSFNLTRSARDPADTTKFEDTAWSPTGEESSHVPSKFGNAWVDALQTDNGAKDYAVWLDRVGGNPKAAKPASTTPLSDAKPVSTSTLSADEYQKLYEGYTPSFLGVQVKDYFAAPAEMMELSSEKSFFTLNVLDEPRQAYAIVDKAKDLESKGETREALKIYQMAIDKYPGAAYRVSPHGVFVSVAAYCQRRILKLPEADVAFYRTLYDGKAKEAFEQAKRSYSLIGFQEVVDTMLATSYGADALLALGDASLDLGNYEEALDRYRAILELFPGSRSDTEETRLKLKLIAKRLGRSALECKTPPKFKSALSPENLNTFATKVEQTPAERIRAVEQRACAPALSASDYAAFDAPRDLLGVQKPTWSRELPGQGEQMVFSQPVVTEDSLLYRHKNIIQCHSLLNGNLRWRCDLGGRITAQNRAEGQLPSEEVVVSDGLVFANLYLVGPSLAALDLLTGQLKWAAGPMAGVTPDDIRIRFESAPAIDSRVVYAAYVKDNIEGDTHFDTAYGVRAFDVLTGRLIWDTEVCRLSPGRMATNISSTRRNRIRSFSSPPILYQGMLYFNTNAGAIAAINARSGRISWIMRYPYWPNIHDSNLGVDPSKLWFNQRPLVVGNDLVVTPVDSPFLLAIDRITGKTIWTLARPDETYAHLLGPTSDGKIVLASSGFSEGSIKVLDPATGKTLVSCASSLKPEVQPLLTTALKPAQWNVGPALVQEWGFHVAARPFLDKKDQLCVLSYDCDAVMNRKYYGYMYNLGVLDLRTGKPVGGYRRHYDSDFKGMVQVYLKAVKDEYTDLEKDKAMKQKSESQIERRQQELLTIMNEKVPEDDVGGPFLPFSRMTFSRRGVQFDLRFGPRSFEMVYDREAYRKAVEPLDDPVTLYAKAELAIMDRDETKAAEWLDACIRKISADDVALRTKINQDLFKVQASIGRARFRQSDLQGQVASALDLWKRANTLPEEIQSLFALSEAYDRSGNATAAAGCLKNLIRHYESRPYQISPLYCRNREEMFKAANASLDRLALQIPATFYHEEMLRSMAVSRASIPIYLDALSPLVRSLTVEAGPLASSRLLDLLDRRPKLRETEEALARTAFEKGTPDVYADLIQEYPRTTAAKEKLARIFTEAQTVQGSEGRRKLARIGEIADLSGVETPAEVAKRILFNCAKPVFGPLAEKMREHPVDLQDTSGSFKLLLPRRDDLKRSAELVFIGARAKRRMDNKFELTCLDAKTGKVLWQRKEIRLKGQGQEPGFSEAFVCDDVVLVHGFYDVLAFRLSDGEPVWRFQAPFDFEIQHALLARDLIILSGKSHTIALYIPTANKNAEVFWEAPEMGEPYMAPYVHGERLISVRNLPSGVTFRRLATGRSLGRLELPELSRNEKHPLITDGPEEVPAVCVGDRIYLNDTWYYIAVDTKGMRILWKRFIDQNDPNNTAPMRMYAGAGCLAVLKKDYQQPALYCLDQETGDLLWRNDPKFPDKLPPMHSIVLDGERITGIVEGTGRGFAVYGGEARTGKRLSSWDSPEQGYQVKAKVDVFPDRYGPHLAYRIQDNQTFGLLVFDTAQRKPVFNMQKNGVGPWDVPGRVSASVQDGKVFLLSGDELIRGGN